jgi:D-sedoheptulose 7-phosphate isomerase
MHAELERLVTRYPDLEPVIPSVEAACKALRETFRAGGILLICGNGGSAADSDHIVGELMKGFELKRPIGAALRERLARIEPERGNYIADRLQRALPAVSLSAHAALNSAIANDTAGDMVYAQQVLGYGLPGSAVLGVSTSGNATNVLNALQVARALDLRTVGLTGRTGGFMRDLCDVAICVPYDRTSDIQERHLAIYHSICIMLELEFFG